MRFTWIILLSLALTGCATAVVYNPMQVDTPQKLLLNENSFKAIQKGMTTQQVHKIMGDALVIGYESRQSPDYKPLTVANPYKSEAVKGTDYTIEYYIESIRRPEGVVSDNELMPLIFKNDKLIGRGWSLANSIRPSKPTV